MKYERFIYFFFSFSEIYGWKHPHCQIFPLWYSCPCICIDAQPPVPHATNACFSNNWGWVQQQPLIHRQSHEVRTQSLVKLQYSCQTNRISLKMYFYQSSFSLLNDMDQWIFLCDWQSKRVMRQLRYQTKMTSYSSPLY